MHIVIFNYVVLFSKKCSSFSPPPPLISLSLSLMLFGKSYSFQHGMDGQTESGKMLFSESETGKCLTDHNCIMWQGFQAGKHVQFSVFAFMWGGGVVSLFHICHLRGNRAILLVQTRCAGVCAETSLFFSSSKI